MLQKLQFCIKILQPLSTAMAQRIVCHFVRNKLENIYNCTYKKIVSFERFSLPSWKLTLKNDQFIYLFLRISYHIFFPAEMTKKELLAFFAYGANRGV